MPAAAMQLPAQLTVANAAAVSRALLAQVPADRNPVVLDASALQQFDSAALATLLELQRVLSARDVGLQVVQVNLAPQQLQERPARQQMAHVANPFGDGRASERITVAIRRHFALPVIAEPPALQ